MDSLMSMGGMDMSSAGMFYDLNTALARLFWYLVGGFLGLALLLRVVAALEVIRRKRLWRTRSIAHPTSPQGLVTQTYATVTAIIRELCYPQIIFLRERGPQWLSPPPLGRSLLLIFYWAIIIALLTFLAIADDAYYWERIGFRAAWVSVTQVPLVYFIASKISIIGQLSGTSYERLNWLHRWVSRTLLVSITVHGSFFVAEWARADFVQLELQMMPMVKYGLGAWAVLLWTVFSSLVPIRRMAYEVFVLQHIAAAAIFLWLLYVHVPSYARYNVWLSIGILVFSRFTGIVWSLWQNLATHGANARVSCMSIGYLAELRAMGCNMTLLTLRDVRFTWKAGQHMYLWLPGLGVLESHPFTLSNIPSTKPSGAAEFVIQAHSGFTRRLYDRALTAQRDEPLVFKTFVAGPFGCPPVWNAFETLILISAGTGASFTLPILESVLQEPYCVQTIDLLLLIKTKEHGTHYIERLRRCIDYAKSHGILLHMQVNVTEAYKVGCANSEDMVAIKQEKKEVAEVSTSTIRYSQKRVNIPEYIRNPVESSGGETSIVVCGGQKLVASVRNTVASLSNERAAHKGTGAQGIHLHVEEYCF
ncbi:hypothetical protein MMC13_005208 [Lambiella insularis]|nr:hypothetical protein [Lambiella insularis]